MAQPIDISNAAVHGHVAALVTHPGYYYLYALYADYPLNQAWFREPEYAALLRERLRLIRPLLGLVQPYRKSEALRLFTERHATGRFPPEKVDEAWRQLRAVLERIGAPAGWPDAPPPEPPYRTPLPPALRRKRRSPRARPRRARAAAPQRTPPKPVRPPKSPVDYTQDV